MPAAEIATMMAEYGDVLIAPGRQEVQKLHEASKSELEAAISCHPRYRALVGT